MPDRVGVAVAGAGFMGGVHAGLLHADPRVTVAWIVDPDEQAAAALAARVGARAAPALAEALADESVELVVVATPAATHAPIASAALAAGRHVLAEKPLVLSADEAERLVATARQRRRVLAYGGNFVYAPKFVRAQRLATDPVAMGTLTSVRVAFRNPGPDSDWFHNRALAGGGVLTDLGWHAVELCWWMLGKPRVETVTACARQVTGTGDVEEHGLIVLGFAGGALGQCDVSWVCPGDEQLTVEVLGTDGTVTADLWQGMGISAYTRNKFAGVWEPNTGWLRPEWEWIRNSGYQHQDRQVIDAVIDGAPLAHPATGAVTILRVIEAAYRSAAEGRSIEIHG